MLWLWVGLAQAALPGIDAPVKTGLRADGEAAVVVGIEDYFVMPDVPYAGRDAQAVYDFLVYTRGIPSAQVQLLDRSPVREKILKAVEDAAAEAASGGTVWIYFAGHGAASPTSGERLLLGADAQPDLDVFEARAIPVAELRAAATAKGARAILVMDACYSGRTRGGGDLIAGKRFAVPSYAAVAEPTVLEWSAAGPSEWSGPLEAARHGAFTYTVLGALRGWADGQLDGRPDGRVTAEEADLYVREALRTLQIRDQVPVMAVDGAWVLSRGTEARPALQPVSAAAAISAPAPAAPPAAPAPPPSRVHGYAEEGSPEVRRIAHGKRIEGIELLKELMSRPDVTGETRAEMLLRLADLYFQEGAYRLDTGSDVGSYLTNAEATYEEILASHPQFARRDQAVYYLACTQATLGKMAEARQNLQDLPRLYPGSDHLDDAAKLLSELP